MTMNLFQKIGAMEAASQHGINPHVLCKCAGPEEVVRALVPLIDDASIAGVKAVRQHGSKKTMRKNQEEDMAGGLTLDKVARDSSYDVAKAIALTSILTGNLAGATYFFANRHSRQEDIQNEALKRRIQLYRNVSEELRNKFGPTAEAVERESPDVPTTSVPASAVKPPFLDRGEATGA